MIKKKWFKNLFIGLIIVLSSTVLFALTSGNPPVPPGSNSSGSEGMAFGSTPELPSDWFDLPPVPPNVPYIPSGYEPEDFLDYEEPDDDDARGFSGSGGGDGGGTGGGGRGGNTDPSTPGSSSGNGGGQLWNE